jgi:hypothetical protein
MPKGSGIYEDEPREHRKTYSPDSADAKGEDHTPDVPDPKQTKEPPD